PWLLHKVGEAPILGTDGSLAWSVESHAVLQENPVPKLLAQGIQDQAHVRVLEWPRGTGRRKVRAEQQGGGIGGVDRPQRLRYIHVYPPEAGRLDPYPTLDQAEEGREAGSRKAKVVDTHLRQAEQAGFQIREIPRV